MRMLCRDVRQMWQKKAAVKAHAARRSASDAMATWKAASKAASDVRAMRWLTCDATIRQERSALQQLGKSAVQCVCGNNTRPCPESEDAER